MKDSRPGITVASFAACLFGLLLTGILTQISQVLLNQAHAPEQTLAAPAIIVFLGLLAVVGFVWGLRRTAFFSREELLCILFAMLLAAPLMTQAFWHRIFGIAGTIPRSGDFAKLDSFNDKLWPHGPNLLTGRLDEANAVDRAVAGGHTWEEIEFAAGRAARLLVLANSQKGELATVRLTLPATAPGRDPVLANIPYLLTVLLRPHDLAADSTYFCRIYYGAGDEFEEVFRESRPARVTFEHQTGFLRVGRYGVRLAPRVADGVTLEFGLEGPGRLALTDAKLLSVDALEAGYTGKRFVTQAAYEALPAAERAGLIVRPDRLWSLAGLQFILTGYIPWGDWLQPLMAWSLLFGLILLATLTVGVIMRKQWAENERFPFPVARIPLAFLDDENGGRKPFGAIWRDRLMWTGFALTLAWCLMRGWHFYNPKVPNLEIEVPMGQYFSSPDWGNMWNITFTVKAIFLALAVFMELNILLSLVVGFFLFRALFWLGRVTGWDASVDYPFGAHQSLASYLMYGLLVLFFARKYLGRVVRAAWRNDRAASIGEIFSYRTALILLALSFVGIGLWAVWLQISPLAMLLYFGFLVLVGMVAAKFRVECGAPFGYYSPYAVWLFISAVGGLTVFGTSGVLVCLIASFMLAETVFFLIPGAQLELAEIGRRFQVTPRHLLYTCLIGIGGGMLVGGWVFLSNAYALGGDTLSYQWAFANKGWYFHKYNAAVNEATSGLTGEGAAATAPGGWFRPSTWAYIYAAGSTGVVTVLRQLFAGFWFHPFGFIMSGSRMMEFYLWGSCLMAWVIRGLVLKIGGAATVRNKLIPFFIGVFLAGTVSYLIWGAYGCYLMANDVDRIYGALP